MTRWTSKSTLLLRQAWRWLLIVTVGILSVHVYAGEIGDEARRRLLQLSVEIASTVKWVRDSGGILVFRKPTAAWCTPFLRDFLTLNNIDNVDAQFLPQANHREHVADSPNDQPIPTIDPAYDVSLVNGTRLVRGYVTARWRNKLLLLSVQGGCLGSSPREQSDCRRSAHWLQVHQASRNHHPFDDIQCNMTAMSREALPQWRGEVVLIRFEALEEVLR